MIIRQLIPHLATWFGVLLLIPMMAAQATIIVGTPATFSSGFSRPAGDIHTFDNTALGGFNADGFDKLVVVFSGENHAGGVDTGGITYNGQPMQEANKVSTLEAANGQHWAYIYYLDNPSGQGSLVFDMNDGNGVGGALFGLQNTASGFGAAEQNGDGNSVSITTTSANSLIVAVGTNNSGVTSAPNPSFPGDLVEIARMDSGSSAHGSGYVQMSGIGGTVQPTFTGGVITVAAEFTAVPEPSTTALMILGGLALLRRVRCG